MLRSLQPKMFALALATYSPFVIGSEASANPTYTCRDLEPEAAPSSPFVTGSEAAANLEPEAAPSPKLPPSKAGNFRLAKLDIKSSTTNI